MVVVVVVVVVVAVVVLSINVIEVVFNWPLCCSFNFDCRQAGFKKTFANYLSWSTKWNRKKRRE